MLDRLTKKLEKLGFVVRGGFFDAGERQTVIMIGNVGSHLWEPFQAEINWSDPNPLDAWTKKKLDPLAKEYRFKVIYPFTGPEYAPFQTWAMQADCVYTSPLGMLIHPEYGLWHAYRAAFVYDGQLDVSIGASCGPSPCDSCAERPCLSACPVSAFSDEGYDVAACMDYLRQDSGCMCCKEGCQSRLACPVGQHYAYEPDHARFHMEKFLSSEI